MGGVEGQRDGEGEGEEDCAEGCPDEAAGEQLGEQDPAPVGFGQVGPDDGAVAVLSRADQDPEDQHRHRGDRTDGEDLPGVCCCAERRDPRLAGQQDVGGGAGEAQHCDEAEGGVEGSGGAELEQLDADEVRHDVAAWGWIRAWKTVSRSSPWARMSRMTAPTSRAARPMTSRFTSATVISPWP